MRAVNISDETRVEMILGAVIAESRPVAVFTWERSSAAALREVSVRRAELTARVIGESVLDFVEIFGDAERLSFSACTDGTRATAIATVMSAREIEAICRKSRCIASRN